MAPQRRAGGGCGRVGEQGGLNWITYVPNLLSIYLAKPAHNTGGSGSTLVAPGLHMCFPINFHQVELCSVVKSAP